MKNQIAIEFIVYSSLAMIIVLVTLSVLANYYVSTKNDQAVQEMTLYGRTLQKELIIASQVKPGFSRELRIPETILGNDYTITNDAYSFTLQYQESIRVFQTPEMQGSFSKGLNTIQYDGQKILIV